MSVKFVVGFALMIEVLNVTFQCSRMYAEEL